MLNSIRNRLISAGSFAAAWLVASWMLAPANAEGPALTAFQPIVRFAGNVASDSPDANQTVVWEPVQSEGFVTTGLAQYHPWKIWVGFNINVIDDGLSRPNPIAEQRTADDLNGNGGSGFTRVIDGNGEVVGIISDFGDLHTFNVFYDRIVVQTEQETTSLELAKQQVFLTTGGENTAATGWRLEAYHDNWQVVVGDEARGLWSINTEVLKPISSDHLRQILEASRFSLYGTAGLRGIHHDNDFLFDASGSILGRTRVSQTIDHYAIGPQLGLGVVAEASMFRFEAVALGLVGYGRVKNEQSGIFGEELVPGALNRPIASRTTQSASDSDEEHVAWHGETRLTGSCQLTQRLRFDATWRWFVTGPAYDAAGSVAWNAPDFGFNQTPADKFYSSDWFLGLTYTH